MLQPSTFIISNIQKCALAFIVAIYILKILCWSLVKLIKYHFLIYYIFITNHLLAFKFCLKSLVLFRFHKNLFVLIKKHKLKSGVQIILINQNLIKFYYKKELHNREWFIVLLIWLTPIQINFKCFLTLLKSFWNLISN